MKPFDPRLLRLAPGARPGIVGLGVLGTISGLTAIAQAFAVAHLVFVVVRSAPLTEAVAAVLGTFALRGLSHAATEIVAARTGAAVSAELRSRLAARVLASGLTGTLGASRGATAADGVIAEDTSSPDTVEDDSDSTAAPTAPPPSKGRDDTPASTTTTPITLLTQGTTSIEPYVARYLPSLVAAAVIPPAAVVAMVVLHPWTALIPVLTLPLLPLFAALIGHATREATDRRWAALSQLSGHFLDVMKGLPTLVGYSRAHRQSATIRKVSDDHRTATVETLRIAFLSSAALEFLATISVAIVAVITGVMLATGRMDLEIALALILIAPEAFWPIRRVGAEFHNAADGAAALDQIAHVLEGDPSPTPPTSTDRVTARDLSFRYAPDLPDVLRGIDLDLGPGLAVLVGPSGAGKTTLLELLAGLRTPTAGELHSPTAHLVTQRPFLAPASMRDNLLLGADATVDDDGLVAVLREVGLADLLAALPAGLDTPLGDDGFGLSAGQRARFALARALLSSAPLVLLDEPTAHLDPQTETMVVDVIRRLARERIVVAVSHRPLLVEVADSRIEIAATVGGGAR